jgi:hypothetical protein
MLRRGFIKCLTAAGTALAAGPAIAQPYPPRPPGYPPYYRPPPPLRYERIPPPPGSAYIWRPGYWYWDGRRYIWHRGMYVPRRHSWHRWVDGQWVRRGGAWVWVPGHWT